MIKGIIFDLDETLINSKDSIVRYHRELFKYLGLKFPEDHAYWFYTLPAEEITKRLFPDETYQNRAREFRRNFDFKKLFEMITPKDGIPEILGVLKNEGKKLGVVTNRGKSARPLLEYLNLIDYFDVVLSANDVVNAKPDPYPIEFIMEKWSILPSETVYVGDSEIDVETGIRANVTIVTVKNSFEGVYFLNSLRELPALITKFEKTKIGEGVT